MEDGSYVLDMQLLCLDPCFVSRLKTLFLQDFDLQIYNPNGSSTSKKVTCNNSLCMHRSQCPGTFSNCPYMVSYVSAETSTSGILVEDVLHLTKEDNHHDLVEANVIFGLVSFIVILSKLINVTLI